MPPPQHHYTYILVSDRTPSRHYTGYATNLHTRLKKHNEGGVPATSDFCPWRVETAVRFSSEQKARTFERYLKSGSGREFARRHF